jgi:hypothetical protein
MKTLKEKFFIAVFIGIDAFCIFQYTDRMGFVLPLAILLSLLVAAVLDIFSYVASFSGAGQLLIIPQMNLPEIKKDKRKALIITVLAVSFVIVFQGVLIYVRTEQIIQKGKELRTATERYDAVIKENNFQSERGRNIYIQNKPIYDGNVIMDYLSIIVPIATTILSFVIGMVGVKEYDKFDKDAERTRDEMLKKQNELNECLDRADSYINVLQAAGEITNLKDTILSDILGSNKNALGNFIAKLENKLRKKAPETYEKQVEKIIHSLKDKAEKICNELSHSADNPNVILGINLERDFENEFNELKKLKLKFISNKN